MPFTVKESQTARAIYAEADQLIGYVPGETLRKDNDYNEMQVVLSARSVSVEAAGMEKERLSIWMNEEQMEMAITRMQAVLSALRGGT